MNVQITENARKELLKLEIGGPRFLRISVIPGGCSGMTYSACLDTALNEGDQTVYRDDPIRIVTDSESAPWLDGLEIDYSNDLISSGFRFSNPNAVKSCGCGSSFGV